jgi:flagellar hook-length control protein FliK
MSNALIDALLPTTKPPRPAEPAPPRANERGSEFAPVLNQALDARPSDAAAAEQNDDEAPAEDEVVAAANSPEAAESEQADSGDESSVEETAETAERPEESEVEVDSDDDDAVEISAEAEAELAAATAAAVATAPLGAAAEANFELPPEAEVVAEIAAAPTTTEQTDDATPSPTSKTADAGQFALAAPDDAEAIPINEASAVNAAPEEPGVATDPELSRKPTPTKEPPRRSLNVSAGEPTKRPTTQESKPARSIRSATHAGDDAEQIPATQIPIEESSERSAEDGKAKKSSDAERAAALKDQQTVTAAPTDSNAVDSLQSAEGARIDSQEVTSNEINQGNDAAVGPQAPDPGRSPVHGTALSRLTAERSLHSTAETAGDGGAVDRGRFVGRVEGAIRAAQQRDGRVQVRLSPPELGALRIELTIQQGALAARLEAETPAARNLLLDNLPALRERLAQQDIRVERFDVDLRQDANSGGGSSQQGAMHERQPREADWRQNHVRADRGRTGTTASPTTIRSSGPSAPSDLGLDVRV